MSATKEKSMPEGPDDKYYFQKCPPPTGSSAWANGGVFAEKDGTSSGLIWIDHFGKRHDFQDNVLRSQTHNSCPKRTGPTHQIPVTEFNHLLRKSDNKLDENTPCPGIVRSDVQNVTALNNKLIDLAIEMKSEISSVTRRNTDTTETSSKVNTELDELIDQVKKHRERIKNLETEISSLDTTIYDNTHLVKSINLHYIAWGISLVTIGLIAMHQLK